MCAGVLMLGASAIPARVMATEAVQQSQTAVQVKGVVLDSNGQPVIGAGVIEVGTQGNGTVTGADGSFTLSINRGAKIRVSYVGYKTVTVTPVAGRTANITLEEESELLNDVVVVGYGTQRKKLVTGSTVHVTSENI